MKLYSTSKGDKDMSDGRGRWYLSIFIPTLAILFKKETDIEGTIRGHKISMPTILHTETSENTFRFTARVLGFGFTVTYREDKR